MSTTLPPIQDLFQGYLPSNGSYDELYDGSRAVRPHAKSFIESLNRLGLEEFTSRWEVSQRMVHENGLAYGGHGATEDNPRPWQLDAVPLLIPASEWRTISLGLQQRAQLLNLVLQDLFGPRQLIKSGVLPAELIFAHPGFHRAYHGQWESPSQVLNCYAADLGRASDGNWCVLADRTESPSGIGYVLENRLVISRMLPELFRECQVQRLASFFQSFQETLRGLASAHRENPRVVLLSHGPTSPNYFEDAYLARYLGLPLVEGGDLAVRNFTTTLKTLGGLLPVDVILRRQNSGDCDPLELNAHSSRGVAGLVQAARLGNVAIVNRLGSGLVESAVFMGYLPALCQALLSEPLRLPGVPTHWCGQPEKLDFVLRNLERLSIQPAFRRRGNDRQWRQSLAQMSPNQLAEMIRARPQDYVAQELSSRSSVPVWREKLETAQVALRAYLVSKSDGFEVMPGALARVSMGSSFSVGSTVVSSATSIQYGEGSKDVWILAVEPVNVNSFIERPGQIEGLRRSTADLPSRAADNLFWLGRYFERADTYARLLRITASRLIGESRFSGTIEIPVLLRCLADQGQIETGYALDNMRAQLKPIETVLPQAVFDGNQPSSLRSVIDELFRLGSIVRDRVSLDTWRIVHGIDEKFQPLRRRATNLSDLLVLTDELLNDLAAFGGTVTESMTRTHSFRFLELGRRVERSIQIINLVKDFFIPMPEVPGPLLETILEISDSLMTYRSRYLANLNLAAVLDLLLADETNPRSLAYQFERLSEQVDRLPRDETEPGYNLVQRISMSLTHSIRMVDVTSIAEVHYLRDYRPFDRLTSDWRMQLQKLSESIALQYWVHAGTSHQLSEVPRE